MKLSALALGVAALMAVSAAGPGPLAAAAAGNTAAATLGKVLSPAADRTPLNKTEAERASKDHKLVSDLLATMPAEAKHLEESRNAIMKGVEESRRRLAELDNESAGALARHVQAAHEHLQLKRQRMMESINDVHSRIDRLQKQDDPLSIENPFAETDSMQQGLEASIAAIKKRLAELNSGPKSEYDEMELSDD